MIQRSLAGGEISPSLYPRVDTVKYATGVRAQRNLMGMKSGGVTSRPGLRHVCRVKDSSLTVRVIPFVFRAGDAYAIEVGPEYMRFVRADSISPIGEDSQAVVSVTEANPGVFEVTSHGFSNGDELFFSGGFAAPDFYKETLSLRRFRVAGVATDTFTLVYLDGPNAGTAVDTSAFDMSTQNFFVARVHEIVTPYLADELFDLQFVQSGDTLTIVHPNHAPQQLTRVAVNSWTIAPISFVPSIAAPGSLAVSGSSGSAAQWVVTAIKAETYEESLMQTPVGSSAVPSGGSPRDVTWAAVSGAIEYNVYRRTGTQTSFGLVAIVAGLAFQDTGVTPSSTDTPPITRNPFPSSTNYPSTVNYVQQRLGLAASISRPENVFLSRPGAYSNFTSRSPLQDDDSITFAPAGPQLNEIRHLLELGRMTLLTSTGEWIVEGGNGGALTPSSINPLQKSYHGSAKVRPVVIGKEAIFVQSRLNVIRNLSFDLQVDNYSNDLTIFAGHLFKGREIIEMAYQQTPHSVLWVVQDDGSLRGMTYERDQEILGWHRHDTAGLFQSVCSVPFLSRDAVYFVVEREIDGATVKTIEVWNDRDVTDQAELSLLDASRRYVYYLTVAGTVTLSGGTTWSTAETLTATLAGWTLPQDEAVGMQLILEEEGSSNPVRFTITGWTSGSVVTGRAARTVPASMRSVALSDYTVATKIVRGLWHLEGMEVAVYADGNVVSNPINLQGSTALTVTNGQITLPKPAAVIHVGLPYIQDLEPLDIDTANGQSLLAAKKLVDLVRMHIEDTRGVWVGPGYPDDSAPLENLTEVKPREDEHYNSPAATKTGIIEISTLGAWTSSGRFLVRQVDPLPMTILSLAPNLVLAGGRT